MQFCRRHLKCSGAPSIWRRPFDSMYYFFWISKYATGPADLLDTIQDHQLFLVALIVLSQSARSKWDDRATHPGTIRFYPTDKIKNDVPTNEYPIVSGTRMLNLKECAGSSLGLRGQGSNDPWDLPLTILLQGLNLDEYGNEKVLLRRRREILNF